MKIKFILGFFASVILFGSCSHDKDVYGNWVIKSDFVSIPRVGAVAFVIDNKAYVGTGYSSVMEDNLEYMNDFHIYQGDQWRTGAQFQVDSIPGYELSGRRSYGSAFALNGRGYAGLGYNGHIRTNDFYKFNPNEKALTVEEVKAHKTSKQWTRIADYPGERNGQRSEASSFTIGNYGYVTCGLDDKQLVNNDMYKLNCTNPDSPKWEHAASMMGPARRGANVFVITDVKGKKRAYLFGGTSASANTPMNDIYIYDPEKDEWTDERPTGIKLTEFDDADFDFQDVARIRAVGFSQDGIGYVTTGITNSGPTKSTWAYNPSKDYWEKKTDFEGNEGPRQGAVGFELENRFYVTLGSSGSGSNNETYTSETWYFEPYKEEEEDD